MELERPHRVKTTPTTSELFICFTSRLSKSSSMRVPSKSMLSHNGSLRGGQSPAMFASKKNKGGSGFDNPEPTSPKVTCIGQVRVKTKKHSKKMKMRASCKSKRLSSSGGEASFRRIEQLGNEGLTLTHKGISTQNQNKQRNQRWVHLPMTICEGLRAFGAEFSCLLPCKSSCFSSNGGKRRKGKRETSSSSCGAVCRWLVAFQEGEGKERDIELVVGGDETEGRERVMERECSRRRSIFDEMEFKDEIFDVNNRDNVEEEEARVSICIPPKNALLLMRCRSDPTKMSSLSSKICDASIPKDDDDNGEEEEEDDDDEGNANVSWVNELEEKIMEVSKDGEKLDEEVNEIDGISEDWVLVEANDEGKKMGCGEIAVSAEEKEQNQQEIRETEEKQSIIDSEQEEIVYGKEEKELPGDENLPNRCPMEVILMEEKLEDLVNSRNSSSSSKESTAESKETGNQEEKRGPTLENEAMASTADEKPPLEEQQGLTHERSERENSPKWEKEKTQEISKPLLPDCLLLMMCEPKLSMEVSKETWVCSTDFIRRLPELHNNKKPNKSDGPDSAKNNKKKPAQPIEPVQPGFQPARSSISFPTGAANLIERKLVKAGGVGCEPFVLTRCKSAPMRSAAKNAPPELACSLWKRGGSRKLEPHQPAACGVGATGAASESDLIAVGSCHVSHGHGLMLCKT